MQIREKKEERPRVSVLMPTFNQAPFICSALKSLLDQTMTQWELVIVDDGSSDNTHKLVKAYLSDSRFHYHRLDSNQGLGAALNHALTYATAPLIAYLPSDDVYYRDHLSSLIDALEIHTEAVMAYSGVRYEQWVPRYGDKSSLGLLEDYPLQLVQAMHRLTPDRWTERDELVTDDLDRMFWTKLRSRGTFVGTDHISCQWVDHPEQRHKMIQEPFGGINPYRSHYHVTQPLRFHASTGYLIDEIENYRRFREREDTPFAADGLKILLVGELAFNPERVLALEERGHKLYGLWISNGHWFNTVGPLPFGHVEDLPQQGWREAVRRLEPDIIYALLNWPSVPLAHQVLTSYPDIPFVWHFKEGPPEFLARGTWSQLVDLYTLSDGQIYCNPEVKNWFGTILPDIVTHGRSFVLDGDLPKRDWFTSQERSPRLSETDGKIHTVVPGRPEGIHPSLVAQLAQQDIHLHFYGEIHQRFFQSWIEEVQKVAPNHLHLHPYVDSQHWVSEFSKYDAGWLRIYKSENEGELRQVHWEDLNYPARLATLASAGVPLIQYDNGEDIAATQSLARRLDIGIFYKNSKQLSEQLHDKERMARLQSHVWSQRDTFTFDYHADSLLDFFRQIIRDSAQNPHDPSRSGL